MSEENLPQLTAEQDIEYRQWMDEWYKYYHSTEPTDRSEVIKWAPGFLRLIYDDQQMPVPPIICIKSPKQATALVWYFEQYTATKAGAAHLAAVTKQVAEAAAARGETLVEDSQEEWQACIDVIGPWAVQYLDTKIAEGHEATIKQHKNADDIANNALRVAGQMDTPYVVGYLYARDTYIPALSESLKKEYEFDQYFKDVITAWSHFVQHAGWGYVFNEIVMICDKPSVWHADRNGTHHCETGPAYSYGPGDTEYYYLEGIQVDEQLVMRPETQTIDQILNEKNEDIKSLRIRRFGIERFLQETGCELLDKAMDEKYNAPEALFSSKKYEANVLFCACPTGRPYFITLPKSVTTCAEAQKYIFVDLKPERLVART
jgi:hypothetical protein